MDNARAYKPGSVWVRELLKAARSTEVSHGE